ncbi:Imm51 family immunity protein [Bacteroides fragilis]|uniref:Imm51 family immunity protein n=1 Tax=Bacteroides fragilis TaxID=817 RepID=UPI00189DFCC2|nr:Imm51 family immunity protein [Bacteroides fragilis]
MKTNKKQSFSKKELKEFNKTIAPFLICNHEDGLYSLLLYEDNKYEHVFVECQKLPNNSVELGYPKGNGYDFEALMKKFLSETMPEDAFNQSIESTKLKVEFLRGESSKNSDKLVYDSEAGMFCVYSKNREKLMKLAVEFKKMCDDTSQLKELISHINFRED